MKNVEGFFQMSNRILKVNVHGVVAIQTKVGLAYVMFTVHIVTLLNTH